MEGQLCPTNQQTEKQLYRLESQVPPSHPGSAKPQTETTWFHKVLLITQNKQARGEQKGNIDNSVSPPELRGGCGEQQPTHLLPSHAVSPTHRNDRLPQVPDAPSQKQVSNVMSHVFYIIFYTVNYYAIISIIICHSIISLLREFR